MAEVYPDLGTATKVLARDILSKGRRVAGIVDPTSIGSTFGEAPRPTWELVAHGFSIDDPRACVVSTPVRSLRLPFAFSQWIWTMDGSNDLEAVSHYNSNGRLFSVDGRVLPGAFGWRLRGLGEPDQLLKIVELLRRDPQSRRAVAIVGRAEDVLSGTRDQPCALSLQFLIRGQRLEAITSMRSQSAAMVLPYDGFLFMAIQCWMAAVLEIEPGLYHHFSGSIHIYEDELLLAEQVAAANPASYRIGSMPNPVEELEDLVAWEHALRSAVIRDDRDSVKSTLQTVRPETTFWEQARSVLADDACERLADLDALPGDTTQRLETALHALTGAGFTKS